MAEELDLKLELELKLSPEACHGPLVERAARILGFDAEAYFPEWQSAVRRTFKQHLGGMPARGELRVRGFVERRTELAREIGFVFTAEAGADIPATLMIPLKGAGPFAAVICMPGHNGSMQLTLGRAGTPRERETPSRGHDFAVQAVRRGYAALAFDPRAFGGRAARGRPGAEPSCHHAAMTALLLGRTLAGERVFDLSRAVDVLETFAEIDPKRIFCMGHSGGGTACYYSAAFDPRIAAVLCSACICSYRKSIAAIEHCADNYLPGILHYLELADIAGLIAPRGLAIVAGAADDIFPLAGVEECVGEIGRIYAAQGAKKKLAVEIVPGGHEFFAEAAWGALERCVAGEG